ncbi:marine proteobacterial sortase target protein [Litorimonas sp. WD9-15]|uniref:marine proteobacterial sortase target protein n=1 Tax=Litorimonas sp. WD9-15 TaxID=3418716 RepID=UPI003D04B0A1
MALRHILITTTTIIAGQSVYSGPAFAETSPPDLRLSQTEDLREMRINEAEAGTLMFHTDIPGQYIEAPRVATDVAMNIAGPVIRTTLSQTFENKTDQWVEGVYVFPLPENAAVDRLRIVIGGRMIEGQIKEKRQAKQIYEQAKSEGKKASLVEQQRPNIFTASVANIGPHETVAIQIEYQDKAVIKDGVFKTRFPMVVAPRFSPPAEVVQVATTEGVQNLVLDPVLDRKAITPPLIDPKLEPVSYIRVPVSLNINLDAGFDIAEVTSPYHNISANLLDNDSANITLAEGDVPANRDFLLEWRAKETQAPYSAVFKETVGENTYLLSMLTPPKADAADIPTQARESIFVIDTSGSMGGQSIAQARESLLLALDQLQPEDTFNIIRFSSDHSKFKFKAVPANPENIAKARRWVRNLRAKGGTQMSPALNAALKVTAEDETRLRQVIFITDGAIGNEQQLFAQIQDDLGDSRLFPVGIGSAPNSYFMSRAAKFGRGSFVQIGNISEVTDRMGTLFKAIDSPVLTDLKSSISGASFPARLPDVYQGDPVISIAKMKTRDLPASFSISGNLAGSTWHETKTLSETEAAKGLSVLWARAKIADLEESRFDRSSAANIDDQILRTALDHHIVSRLTSLVAVDITPSRPMGDDLKTRSVPTMLPEGWKFGELATKRKTNVTHKPSPSVPNTGSGSQQSLALPNTASPHEVLGLIGSLMLLLGLFSAKLTRRETG